MDHNFDHPVFTKIAASKELTREELIDAMSKTKLKPGAAAGMAGFQTIVGANLLHHGGGKGGLAAELSLRGNKKLSLAVKAISYGLPAIAAAALISDQVDYKAKEKLKRHALEQRSTKSLQADYNLLKKNPWYNLLKSTSK